MPVEYNNLHQKGSILCVFNIMPIKGQTDNEFSIIEREMKDNVRAQLCLAYKMGICVK